MTPEQAQQTTLRRAEVVLTDRVQTIVDGFTVVAREAGWDTFEGSSGRCWFITNALANFAVGGGFVASGREVTFKRFHNPRARRPADELAHVLVVDGTVIDFASRGGLDTQDAPWPDVVPFQEFRARYAGQGRICPCCGSPAEHDYGTCRGPFADEVHKERARVEMQQWFELHLLAGRGERYG